MNPPKPFARWPERFVGSAHRIDVSLSRGRLRRVRPIRSMKQEKELSARLGRRAHGFSRIFELLERKRRLNGPLALVETGCLRSLNWEGDGCSSILFHDFA